MFGSETHIYAGCLQKQMLLNIEQNGLGIDKDDNGSLKTVQSRSEKTLDLLI